MRHPLTCAHVRKGKTFLTFQPSICVALSGPWNGVFSHSIWVRVCGYVTSLSLLAKVMWHNLFYNGVAVFEGRK